MKREDQIAIAKQFHTHYTYMKSWFAALVEIRNICAHYGRLYNMPLDSVAKLSPQGKPLCKCTTFHGLPCAQIYYAW